MQEERSQSDAPYVVIYACLMAFAACLHVL